MWRFLFGLWNRIPSVRRRQLERIQKLMAGPYRIVVIRHDLSRELIATGLTLRQAGEIECELITDESVLNFVHEDDTPSA